MRKENNYIVRKPSKVISGESKQIILLSFKINNGQAINSPSILPLFILDIRHRFCCQFSETAHISN